jgi:hypothetical protein
MSGIYPRKSPSRGEIFLEAIMAEKTHPDPSQTTQTELSGCLPIIVRLVWMVFGNAALVLLAGLIIQKGAYSYLDMIFWAIPGLLIVLRYIDITRFQGLTAECEPATLKHWSRYSILLLMTSTVLWVFAHGMRMIIGWQ